MVRPVGPPRTPRQQAAFDCGHRIANYDDWHCVDAANQGGSMAPYFTRTEYAVYQTTSQRQWWLWWWRGYRHDTRKGGR
jgi:hypothetical protein